MLPHIRIGFRGYIKIKYDSLYTGKNKIGKIADAVEKITVARETEKIRREKKKKKRWET